MAARQTKPKSDMITQLETWATAHASISDLQRLPDLSEPIKKANELIQQFQTEYRRPDQTAANLKPTKQLLKQALQQIQESEQKEIEACTEALRYLQNLINIKATSEAASSSLASDRPKRQSSAAPSSTGSAPAGNAGAAAANGNLTLLIPTRNSIALSNQLLERTKKQQPLQQGRRVAFRLPSGDKNGKASSTPPVPGESYEEASWILAIVKKKDEKPNRYVVQDIEGEEGQEPPIYTASLKQLLPLPQVDVPTSDPSHLSAYPEYKAGSTVLALFPDTTSFYKAVVVATPKENTGQRTAPPAARPVPSYKVRFEDDQGQLRLVSAEEVIDFPGF